MMKNRKWLKIIIVTVLLALGLTFVYGRNSKTQLPQLKDAGIIFDEKFGGFYADITINEFNELGFSYGDSVDIKLSNGQKLEDVPYYNGYYTKTNEPLICAYPGYPHIKIGLNNGPDLYEMLGCDENTKVTITLKEAGKYIVVQNVMDTVYENDRASFDSDEMFANYRAMKGGNLKENLFYRSASPVNNEYNRAFYANSLMEKDGIKLVLDLADSEDNLKGYMLKDDFRSSYAASLYNEGKIVLMSMSSNYRADVYKQKVVQGLTAVIENEGPYLIHCTEGKDRTGFVAILIEALCQAGYEEMLEDYMTTYYNYYRISEETAKAQYDAIIDLKFNDMIFYLGEVDTVQEVKNADLQQKAVNYLLSGGMSQQQIEQLISVLSR